MHGTLRAQKKKKGKKVFGKRSEGTSDIYAYQCISFVEMHCLYRIISPFANLMSVFGTLFFFRRVDFHLIFFLTFFQTFFTFSLTFSALLVEGGGPKFVRTGPNPAILDF